MVGGGGDNVLLFRFSLSFILYYSVKVKLGLLKLILTFRLFSWRALLFLDNFDVNIVKKIKRAVIHVL